MIKLSVNKRIAVFTMALLILTMGLISYMGLPRESTPEIKQPYIFVTTVYPGVGAKDVETLVTRPIEQEIDGIEGIKEITSSTQQSLSMIIIEFTSDVEVETALRRVKDRVDIAESELPDAVEDPLVKEFSSSTWPILVVALTNPNGLEYLENTAEELQDELERIPGVLEAEISGLRERELRIELDPAKLNRYGFGMGDIQQAIQGANLALPGGILRTPGKNYTITINSEIKDPRLFREITIKDGPVAVPLRLLGTVKFTYEEQQTYSRFNGKPAITISVSKRTGANVITTTERVKEAVDGMKSQFAEGTEINYGYEDAFYIKQIVADLENNMITGFLLVLAVTIFFLGGINALFVALAIPFSMLLSFFIIDMLGITLNMVVLFSLILALGMLVDNGIVIVENIFRHASMGKDRVQAAIDGSKEVAMPITASTITTCLAFLPIVFMPGVMGDFMSFVPKTVIIVLGSSLFVAVTINPAFCSRFLKISKEQQKKFTEGSGKFAGIQNWYAHNIHKALRHPLLVMSISFAVVICGMVLYGILGKEPVFFPSPDPSDAIVNVTMPQGTPVEKTDSVVRVLEHIVEDVPASIDEYEAAAGRSGGQMFSGSGEESHKGFVRVTYKPYLERKIKGKVAIDSLKNRLKDFTGGEVTVEAQEMGPPSGHDISFEVTGKDYNIMGDIADSILAILNTYSHFKLVDTDYESAMPELQVAVNRQMAEYHGLSMYAVAGKIRNAIHGQIVGAFRQGEKEYDIVSEFKTPSRNSIPELKQIHISTRDGVKIPLSDIATVKTVSSIGTIKRRNVERSVGIWADFDEKFQKKNEIKAEIEKKVKQLALPANYSTRAGAGQEMRDEANDYIIKAFAIALFLITIVLVAQFNSIFQPIIIMTSVFLSLGGVFWGFTFTGMEFVMIMSGIGCVALAGVAVNNCIVLIDYTNLLVDNGMDWFEAIIEAGKTRLRPVLLTAITTVLGLLPMALGASLDLHPGSFGIQLGSESSEFWRPFAWTMIFGLTFATVMTLLVVPT
ncbi:MAG: MMPL family transporter, partial [Chitinivibrionales bacterium]|nr:MMPL family transporter [Chitinivibrionales bacterium]